MTDTTLASRAATLAASLEETARATDADGLSKAHFDALVAAGLTKSADIATLMETGRALAHGCGASAWLAVSLAETARAAAGVVDGVIAPASFAESASIEKSGDGYVVNGVWPSVGGLPFADWILLDGLTLDGAPVRALVPVNAAVQEDPVYFGGLRGVKWRRIEIKDAKLPASHIIAGAAPPSGAGLLGAVLGTAEGAYRDYVRGTRARVSGVGGKAVAQFTQVQARLAESHAEMKALTALYQDVLAKAPTASGETLVEIERDRAYIARRAVEAINRLLTQMGAMGLAETNPVQRRFRDLRALAASPGLDWVSQMTAFGRVELGITEAAANSAA